MENVWSKHDPDISLWFTETQRGEDRNQQLTFLEKIKGFSLSQDTNVWRATVSNKS